MACLLATSPGLPQPFLREHVAVQLPGEPTLMHNLHNVHNDKSPEGYKPLTLKS